MEPPTGAALACRLCATPLPRPFLDLGDQPIPDRLLDPAGPLAAMEDPRVRTALAACSACGLIQLDATPPPDVDEGHGHGVEVSSSLANADRDWAAELLQRLPNDGRGRVAVLGDAWAIAPVVRTGGHDVAATAGADDLDLIIANHALAHVDDLDGALGDLARSVRPGGLVAIETHHALGLAGGQFDVVTPVHRSYLSLGVLEPALRSHGLAVIEARTVDRYGGALRILARRVDPDRPAPTPRPDEVDAILAAEAAAGLGDPTALAAIGRRADAVRAALRAFLRRSTSEGQRVVGYGAASRGIALLNMVGATADEIPLIVDRSPAKQGRLTPGGRIPIGDPALLPGLHPEHLLVLAWPLLPEIAREQAGIAAWGGRFVVALPNLRILEPDAAVGALR